MSDPSQLSRRERQIMDAVYARGRATVSEVAAAIPDPPTRTAVRTLLRILEAKGHLRHYREGREFVYRPTRPRARAARSAMRRLLGTFFGGSLAGAVAAHLSDPAARLSQEELRQLTQLIEEANRQGR